MKTIQWIMGITCTLAVGMAFHGCNSDPFPVGESFSQGFQVPLVPTYTFNFKTGSETVLGEQGNLKIVSGADIKNLITATPGVSEQSRDKGVISGVIVDRLGRSLPSVSIGATDKAGRVIRNPNGSVTAGVTDASGEIVASVLYNSINGVPEFINTAGTAPSGSFTALNVPPGEHFIKAVQGGRGNARVDIFAGSLSLINMDVFPVTLPSVNVTGIVHERDGIARAGQTELSFPGLGGMLTTGSSGAFSVSGFGSESTFLVKAKTAGHVDTYQEMFTDLGSLTLSAVTPQITKNVTVISNQDLQTMVLASGATLNAGQGMVLGKVLESNGKKNNAVITFTDTAGSSVGDVFYFPTGSDRPVCNTPNVNGCLTMTSVEGRFLALNLPTGDVFIKVSAEVDAGDGSGDKVKSTGGLRLQIFPDAITLKDFALQVTLREDPLAPAPPPKPPTWYTVNMSGTVREEDRTTPVGDASVSLLGATGVLSTSNSGTGEYTVAAGAGPSEVSPLLSSSTHLFRVEKTGYATTYQTIQTGVQDLITDLTIVSSTLVGPTAGTGTVMGRLINRRLGGRVSEVEVVATQMTDQNGQTVTTGQKTGNIQYFDLDENIDVTATSSSNNGLFLIKNLPPGLVMLKAASSDDSGNQIVRVFPDGVTLTNMPVNHVPVNVPVQGSLSDLHNTPVTGATLTLLGEGGSFTSESLSLSPGVPLPANGSFITKVQKNGMIDTYNYQLKTGLEEQTGAAFFTASQSELSSLAAQGGLSLDLGKGIIAGQVLEKFFTDGAAPITTGASPKAMVSGFFNEDAFLDLAVTHGPNQVQIFLGQAGGTFIPAPFPAITVGNDPTSIGAGDFNRDGRTDVVVANRGSDSLSILFGIGNGQFVNPSGTQLLTNDGIGTAPVSVKVADLDRNGHLDLAVANEGSHNLTILMGDGSGGFSLSGSPCSTPCPMPVMPVSIAAADFDSDSNLDLAIAGTGSSTVRLLLSGEGLPTEFVVAGNTPSAVVTGDLNGDSHFDLVVANAGSHSLSTFLGDGNGVFNKVDCVLGSAPDTVQEDCPLTNGSTPRAILLLDIDEDGRLDLIVANEGTSTVAFHPGTGDGRFAPASRSFSVGTSPVALVSGDFNQDGREDLISLNTGANQFSLILSDLQPVKNAVIEVRDLNGTLSGAVRYINNALDVDPSLSGSSDSGRFIVFDLPFGLNMIKGLRPATNTAPIVKTLIGNALVNITEVGTLAYTEVKLETGEPGSITVSGVTCRVVGETCTKIGNSQINMLGTPVAEICPPGPNCLSSTDNATYTLRLDPHSTYVARILGPKAILPGDTDGDGIPDKDDNCPNIPNQDQVDANGNRVGDRCEQFIDDKDDDGIADLQDNCPDVPNPDQRNTDQDFLGDACDPTPNGKPTKTKAKPPAP